MLKLNDMNFQTLIQPENETEQKIIANPQWQEGVLWGMTREGHPEGKVISHIQEVLKNIDRFIHFLSHFVKRVFLVRNIGDSLRG